MEMDVGGFTKDDSCTIAKCEASQKHEDHEDREDHEDHAFLYVEVVRKELA